MKRYQIEDVINSSHEVWDDEGVLECPKCQSDYVHIFENNYPWETEIKANGTYTIDGNDSYRTGCGLRGDLLIIPFWAECGSIFDICFGFHKGQTFTFCRLRQACERNT